MSFTEPPEKKQRVGAPKNFRRSRGLALKPKIDMMFTMIEYVNKKRVVGEQPNWDEMVRFDFEGLSGHGMQQLPSLQRDKRSGLVLHPKLPSRSVLEQHREETTHLNPLVSIGMDNREFVIMIHQFPIFICGSAGDNTTYVQNLVMNNPSIILP